MTIPGPPGRGPRRDPATGMDPMPGSTPLPGDVGDRPDEVPDPRRPGRRPDGPPDRPDGLATFVATGRDDRLRHVVDVASGALGDPVGLRARCGAAVEHVVPGAGAERADCPGCRLDVLR